MRAPWASISSRVSGRAIRGRQGNCWLDRQSCRRSAPAPTASPPPVPQSRSSRGCRRRQGRRASATRPQCSGWSRSGRSGSSSSRHHTTPRRLCRLACRCRHVSLPALTPSVCPASTLPNALPSNCVPELHQRVPETPTKACTATPATQSMHCGRAQEAAAPLASGSAAAAAASAALRFFSATCSSAVAGDRGMQQGRVGEEGTRAAR